MRKKMIGIVSIVVVCALMPVNAHAAYNTQDSVIDKASDWAATLGKTPEDRDMILTQRRAERAAKRLREAMQKSSKKAGKALEKAGKDMGKMFE